MIKSFIAISTVIYVIYKYNNMSTIIKKSFIARCFLEGSIKLWPFLSQTTNENDNIGIFIIFIIIVIITDKLFGGIWGTG